MSKDYLSTLFTIFITFVTSASSVGMETDQLLASIKDEIPAREHGEGHYDQLIIRGAYMIDGSGAPTTCLLYTSPSPRDRTRSRMPSSA